MGCCPDAVHGITLFTKITTAVLKVEDRPPYMTNGIQAAVVEWIRALDLEIISLLLSRAWPMSLLGISELQWRPTELRDTDDVVRLDRRQRLIRWDRRPPNEIFLEGFVPIVTRENPDWEETDLYGFVKNNHPSIFVSTTKTQRQKKRKYVWTPRSASRGIVYQYEIYAPGGVDVNDSFSDASPYHNQMEVAFPGGIQNIYIRSARELHNGRIQRIWLNPNFLDPGDLETIASSSRTPQVVWRINHPDGGHKDGRSERSAGSHDDLMYGGEGDVQEDTFGDESNNPRPIAAGEFMIESIKDKNSFLDLSKNVNGGIIHNNVYSGGNSQIWVFSYHDKKKAYKIKSYQNSSLFLSWDSNAPSKEMILRGYTNSGSNNQYWQIEQTGKNYRLRNLLNLDMIITAQDKSSAFGGKEVIVNTEITNSNTKISQEWKMIPFDFRPIMDGDYNIFNLDLSNQVVDFSNQPDLLVHGHEFCDNENQTWHFTYNSTHHAYQIWSGRKSNLLLTWDSNAASKEMVVRAYTESRSKNQYWRIEPTSSKSCKLRNLENSSMILGLSKVSTPNGELNLMVEDDSDGHSNLHSDWDIKPIFYQYIPDGDYNIFNDNFPNIVVDFTNQKGSLIHGNNYCSNNNQKWSFIYDGKKKAYKIKSGVRAKLWLSWDSNASSKEMVLRAYTESGSKNQYWRLEPANDGSYRLRNLHEFKKCIAITNKNTPYGGKELIVSETKENGNTWYLKNLGEVGLPNRKFRIATKLNYKKVIDSSTSYNLIITHDLNFASSIWKLVYDSSKKAYNIYSSDINNLGWIYQNKNFLVKLGNIDGPDHGDLRYFWTIEYSMQTGCYLIRSLYDPALAVGYTDKDSVITDTSTYADNQLFHFILM
ncbi:pierisin-like isoform X3 [Pieris napi]|uniref:pierisin-like isoform X3 n=1 Tax=Pieris napi TaxID=78633 RepID=UPI001FBA5596|nr:pierisin-like isoform X3 [Pieris napi]